MKIVDKKKFIPTLLISVLWVLSYFFSNDISGYIFKTKTIPFYPFLIPIVIHGILLSFFLWVKTRKNISIITLFHLIYSAFLVNFWFPEAFNSTGFTFGATIGLSFALTQLKPPAYLIGHVLYFVVGGATFYLKGRLIGQDEYSTFAIIMGIFLFFPGLNYYLARLKKNLKEEHRIAENLSHNLNKLVHQQTKKIKEQNTGLKNLLSNIDQGILIFDRDSIISWDYTDITSTFFNQDPCKQKFEHLLQLNEQETEEFKKWIIHVFKGLVPFKDLLPLAPSLFTKNQNRIISLTYKPLFGDQDHKKIERVMCIANDITETIALEKKAKLEHENAQRINNILDRPLEFLDLISDSEDVIAHHSKHLTALKPQDLFRSFHTLKAQFSSFQLSDIVKNIHELESFIDSLNEDWNEQNQLKIQKCLLSIQHSYNSFIKKNRRLLELANNAISNANEAGSLKALMKTIGLAIENYQNDFVLKEISTLFRGFIGPTKELALSQDKLVRIEIQPSYIYIDPQKYQSFFHALFHIFRNAIDHGLENREERIAQNKSEEGTIKISFEKKNSNILILIEDDGRGIDPERIRTIASEKEAFDNLDLDKVPDHKILQLIFEPQLSSKEEITSVSGRGVGLNAVKVETKKIGGLVSVVSEIHFKTKFSIIIPQLS
jgi:two-component system chemotaxis sensor kinase CheA